ncbi:MAG TPA: hypothetical protein VI546_00455 [candidate division Zixibacteria bacterium]|nr:hypothetical protein [candidate division Zixibacteria bacterium]
MKRKTLLTTLTALLALGTAAGLAAVPQLLSLQGSLKDAGGNPVRNQTVSVQFTIYDAAAAGTVKWTETQPSVTTNNDGAFSVLLGSVTPVPDAVFDGPDRWLGIKIGGDPEMTPRTRLASGGYAYRVNSIDEASGGDIRGNVTLHSILVIGDGTSAGYINMTNGPDFTVHIGGKDAADNGAVAELDNSSNNTTILLDADDFQAGDVGARVSVSDGTTNTIELDAYDVGTGGLLTMTDGSDTTITLDARSGGTGAYFEMTDGTRKTVHLDANGVSGGAQFSLLEGDQGSTTISLDAESGTNGGGAIVLANGANPAVTTIVLDAQEATGNGAQIELRQADGTATVIIDGEETGGGADLSLRKGNGTETIVLDADWGGTGFGRIVTSELQINGGADLSEQFDVKAKDGKLEPGMIVSIDTEHPGNLRVCRQAYDRRVAGIISGAGNVRPGMLMGQSGSGANGTHPVALTGRVYCWADASNGAIEPGDLLTTSDTPGSAMKVTDYGKAQGAIIGKAMGSLKEGKGLVLVLVNLQ